MVARALSGDLVYSPHRVRFLLAHWEELEALVGGGPAVAHLRLYLDHEWALLQSDGARRACLCPLGETTPPAQAGRGSAYGDGAHGAQHTLADLKRAADTLPITWQATRAIYALQGRAGEWRLRASLSPLAPRSVELLGDAAGDYLLATRRMAEALGWRPGASYVLDTGQRVDAS